MPLNALGSISVSSSGLVIKSGECEVIYDLLDADAVAAALEFGVILPGGPASVARKKAIARLAITIATYVHGALTARAQAKVSTTSSALQRTPNPNVSNAATQAPLVDKFLNIV
jgi:hypothetical protein